MKKALTLLLLLFFGIHSHAQVNIDSLMGIWNNRKLPDTARLESLQKVIHSHYLNIDLDSALYFAQQGLLLAKKGKEEKFAGSFYRSCGSVNYYTGEAELAMTYFDSALSSFNKVNYKQGIASILGNMALIKNIQGYPNEAIKMHSESLKLNREISNHVGAAGALMNLGVIFKDQGRIDEAWDNFQKSKILYESISNTEGVVMNLINMATIHEHNGNFKECLSTYDSALIMLEQMPNDRLLSIIYNSIGLIHHKQGNHEKAVKYYLSCERIKERLRDPYGQAYVLSNLAFLYQEQGDYVGMEDVEKRVFQIYRSVDDTVSLTHTWVGHIDAKVQMQPDFNPVAAYLKCLQTYWEFNNLEGEAVVQSNLASYYISKDILDSAGHFYSLALDGFQSLGDSAKIAHCLLGLAKVELKKEDYLHAEAYCKRGHGIAKRIGLIGTLINSTDILKQVFKSTGRFKEALEMHELNVLLRDSIMSEENQRETIRTEFSREAEQRDNEIAILNLENEKKQAETAAERNKRMFTLGISGSLILLLLGGGFSVQRSRKQKHQVEITRAELQKNLVENDFLRSQLDPHFIKNALFNIDHLLRKNRTEEAQRYTDSFNRLMNLTLENSRRNLVGLDEELEMMKHYLSLEADRSENRLVWSVNVADDVNPEEIELPPMILQPLVENALKHGANMKDGKGEVKLEVRVENERVVCIVEDNGGGISPTPALPKGEGEALRSKTSHGLRITRERLEMFSRLNLADARLEILNTGNGTRAIISFALA